MLDSRLSLYHFLLLSFSFISDVTHVYNRPLACIISPYHFAALVNTLMDLKAIFYAVKISLHEVTLYTIANFL